MNEERPEPPAPASDDPAPQDHSFHPRRSRHGRAPKDQRGDRNKRKLGAAVRSLVNWSSAPSSARR